MAATSNEQRTTDIIADDMEQNEEIMAMMMGQPTDRYTHARTHARTRTHAYTRKDAPQPPHSSNTTKRPVFSFKDITLTLAGRKFNHRLNIHIHVIRMKKSKRGLNTSSVLSDMICHRLLEECMTPNKKTSTQLERRLQRVG